MTSEVPRCQHVAEADPTKKFGTDAIRNHIDHFRPVLAWIVVHTKRSLAKGSSDHFDDGVRNALDRPVLRQKFVSSAMDRTKVLGMGGF